MIYISKICPELDKISIDNQFLNGQPSSLIWFSTTLWYCKYLKLDKVFIVW